MTVEAGNENESENRKLIMWTVRFLNNWPPGFVIGDTFARQMELSYERGDDPWEAASAMVEGRFDPEGERIPGVWSP